MRFAISRWQQRLLWGIAFSAVAMTAWGVIFWVATPLANAAFKPLPDENAVIKVLVDAQLPTGAYRFPAWPRGNPRTARISTNTSAAPSGRSSTAAAA